jgi:hypothetical protein
MYYGGYYGRRFKLRCVTCLQVILESRMVITSINLSNSLNVCTYICIRIIVEYQSYPSGRWKPALFEASIVDQLLKEQFYKYIERVKKTDCQAELKRLLAQGPPIYLEDKHALKLDDGDTHVVKLWFARDNQEVTAKLVGALEGEERIHLWEELKQFVVLEGKEEGDDEDDEIQNNDLGESNPNFN